MAFTPTIVRKGRPPGDACPDANLLAAYIDARVTPAERSRVESHLVRCEDCYRVFSEARQEQGSELEVAVLGERRRRLHFGIRWRAAAALAAAAAVVLAVQIFRGRTTGSRETASLSHATHAAGSGTVNAEQAALTLALNELDAASGPYRRFDGRLTVSTGYRPLPAPMRSASAVDDMPLRLRVAALKLELVARSRSPAALRALAAMYLTVGEPRQAAETVTPIANTATEPELLNDIAVAYLARGSEGDAVSALTLLERAVAQSPNRLEPWFNLGLAAHAVGNHSRALEAWARYLALDPSSPWAAEARAHVEILMSARR